MNAWTTQQLAKALNLSAVRISQLVKSRVLPKPREGQHDPLSRDAVDKEFFALGREVRDTLLNMPSRLAGLVSAEKNQENNFQTIEREIQQCLNGLTGKPNGAARA